MKASSINSEAIKKVFLCSVLMASFQLNVLTASRKQFFFQSLFWSRDQHKLFKYRTNGTRYCIT